jgi:hypothetical protein
VGEGDPDQSGIFARLFKISSLANGEVSVVFHVPPLHADMAMRLHTLRNAPVTLEITMGWDDA